MSTSTPGQIYEGKVRSGECPSRDGATQDFCRQLRTPVWLIGCMVSMLKQYFGSDERIALERGTFRWSDKVADSQIYISDDFNWDFENVGQRPAIIVEIAGMDSLKDIPTIGRSGLSGYDPGNDSYIFSSIDNGSMALRVIAGHKLECWALAWEAKMFLHSYADAIRDTYRFKTFGVSKVDPPRPMSEYKEYKFSTVHVPFSMIDAWAIKRENLKVQSIDPTFTAGDGAPLFRTD